jgi:hypothetical protein
MGRTGKIGLLVHACLACKNWQSSFSYVGQFDKDIVDGIKNVRMADNVAAFAPTNRV